MTGTLDMAAARVLAEFPACGPGPRLEPLGNHGGFSGARLWRVAASGATFCLRAWPAPGPSAERLAWVHGLMTQAGRAGLSFVPRVHACRGGATWVMTAGRLWDLTSWLPGSADYHAAPSPARLAEACRAVARLHLAWQRDGRAACPAVLRRLDALGAWLGLCGSGWRPAWGDREVDLLAVRAWRHLERQGQELVSLLGPWAGTRPVQPCICDVWNQHLLFEGDRLTGLVDYGEAKVDHVAVDLARLLGDLAGDDEAGWQTGLAAYRTLRPLTADEERLARVLDRGGVVLGAAAWLRRLYHEGRRYDDMQAVARRLEVLVTRMDGWG